MFTIIGGDGKEYGPVTADQIRSWVTAGRANLDTKAKAVGSEEWRRLADYAEFGLPGSVAPSPTPSFTPDFVPALPAYATVAPTVPLAGRGERLLAQLLDNVIAFACCLPGLILIALAAAKAGISVGGNMSDLATAAGMAAGLIVLCAAAFVLFVVQLWMLITRGQTLGKKALGLRIVAFENETNPGFVRVFLLRVLVPAVVGAVPYLGIFFTMTDICFIFREDRRCIHDLIANTKVIKV